MRDQTEPSVVGWRKLHVDVVLFIVEPESRRNKKLRRIKVFLTSIILIYFNLLNLHFLLVRNVVYGIIYLITSDPLMVAHGSECRLRNTYQ